MKKFFLSRVLAPPLVSVALILGTFLLVPPLVVAQLGGENLRGDYGMKSGSQGPPGFYLGDIFYFYRTGTVKNLTGDDLSKANAHRGLKWNPAWIQEWLFSIKCILL